MCNNIPLSYIKKLYDSMPKGVVEVLELVVQTKIIKFFFLLFYCHVFLFKIFSIKQNIKNNIIY